MDKIWKKFYQCDCGSEGIMMGYEYNEKDEFPPVLDLAFFNSGFEDRKLSLIDRVKLCFRIIKTGTLYIDMVVITQDIAKELGRDLLKFANKRNIPEDLELGNK